MKIFYPYFTNAIGEKVYCQFRGTFKDEQNDVSYSFLIESTGDSIAIKKTNNQWNVLPGYLTLESWPEELGRQIDEFNNQ